MIVNNIDHDRKIRYEKILPNNRYYYCLIPTNHDVVNLKNISNYIKQNDLCLLLDNSLEAFRSIIYVIYKELVSEGNIPEDKIFLMSGNIDIHEHVEIAAKSLNKKPINSIYHNYWEWVTSKDLNQHLSSVEENFSDIWKDRENRSFEKIFLCLNHRWRLHRVLVVGMLFKMGLIDKGYVSLCEFDNDVNYVWGSKIASILKLHSKSKEIYEAFSDRESVQSFPNLRLDNLRANKLPMAAIHSEINDYYKTSLLSLINEAHFYSYYKAQDGVGHFFTPLNEGTRFITEKVYKPMAYQHPFILVSLSNSLSFLREQGYKTFHPYINESYDEEKDDTKRVLLILDEVKRISNFNATEIKQFVRDTIPICEHNFKVLLTKKD